MRRLVPLLLFAFCTFWIGTAAVRAADPVYPKGLPVGLVPPGDFKLSTRFPGYEDAGRKASISIVTLPLPAYNDIERSIFSNNQAGLADVKRESFPFQSGIGFLITGHGTENGVPTHKWFLAATGSGQFTGLTLLIKVDVPDTALSVYSDAVIRQALESVTLRVPPTDEILSLLPFKLSDLAGFRVFRVPDRSGLVLIDGAGQDLVKQPYMIITLGNGAPESPDAQAQFSRELIRTMPLRDLSVTLFDKIRIGGYPAYEVRASATGMDGKPLSIVQWVRINGTVFTRVLGVVHKDKWDEFFPRFRQVRDGINLREGP